MKKIILSIIILFTTLSLANADTDIFSVDGLGIENKCTFMPSGIFLVINVNETKFNRAVNSIMHYPPQKIHSIVAPWQGKTTLEKVRKALTFIWACDAILTPQITGIAFDYHQEIITAVVNVNEHTAYTMAHIHTNVLYYTQRKLIKILTPYNMHNGDLDKIQALYLKLFQVED